MKYDQTIQRKRKTTTSSYPYQRKDKTIKLLEFKEFMQLPLGLASVNYSIITYNTATGDIGMQLLYLLLVIGRLAALMIIECFIVLCDAFLV